MTKDDAIFNWLQIKYVAEQRTNDQAAQETYQFFTAILTEDHKLDELQVQIADGMYVVSFTDEGKPGQKKFPAEFVRQLYLDIENEPKFNQ
ncbi:hypothetical protein [Bacillus horti]|uniref:Uncharacterized protein n=1 Tax=Caldalkalibacillus horti TaxID=77523 RepID=A0ABT9W0X5_9BACI|nr:hypothetical protein [Bacillus horti]MDQ0166927.1 hypothetical protein [Bacillus horti]